MRLSLWYEGIADTFVSGRSHAMTHPMSLGESVYTVVTRERVMIRDRRRMTMRYPVRTTSGLVTTMR